MTESGGAPPRNARRTTFIVLTVLFGLGIGIGTFAFPSLVAAWFGVGGREIHRVHDLSWGALAGLLIALPFLLQARRPETKPAVMQGAAAAGLGLTLGWALSGQYIGALLPIVVTVLLWWFHPSRGQSMRLGGRPEPIMGAFTVLAAIPLVIYAFDQASIQRVCVQGNPHCDELHYGSMAALCLALPLVALVASFRTPGWRIVARLAAAAAVVLGLASLLFPGLESSLGTSWGGVTIAGGVLFLAVAEWTARRKEAAG